LLAYREFPGALGGFHGEFREFHEFKAYREFPGFFHGIYRVYPALHTKNINIA